jgi:GNAT superfamily N-acetyltransferase
MLVREIDAAASADLRRAVLRGGRPVPLPGDEAPSFHVGVYDEGVLLATGNVRPEPAPRLPGTEPAPGQDWRVRGMATDPAHRGRGAGTLVLDALVRHARDQGGEVLWCNARTPAQGFYERAGLQTRGEPWVDPEIGPHVMMWRRL